MSLDFKNFLIKYTTVDIDFVNDFYDAINEKYIENYNDFIIDAEKLRKWLQITTKKDFKQTLIDSYKKNVDYTVIRKKLTNGSGGS